MKKRRKGQWWKVTLMAAAVLASMVILCEKYVEYLVEKEKKETEIYMRELTEMTGRVFRDRVDGYISTLEGVAAVLPADRKEEDQAKRMLQAQLDTGKFKRYGIIYADGHGVAAEQGGRWLEADHFEEKKYFQEAMKGVPYISSPLPDRFSEDRMVLMSVPVYGREGGVEAVACGMLDEDAFCSAMEQKMLGGQGYWNVIDGKGNVLFRSAASDASGSRQNIFDLSYEKAEGLDEMKENMAQAESGVMSFTKPGGIAKYVVYMPFYVNDWYIVSIAPETYVTAMEQQIRQSSIILTGTVIAVICLLWLGLIFIDRRRRQEIRRLAYYDKMTGAGNTDLFFKKMAQVTDLFHGSYALAVLDLCNFKAYNDLFGFDKGDIIICGIYRIIQDMLKPEEVCAREVADHFWLLLHEASDEKLRERMQEVFQNIEGIDHHSDKIAYTLTARCGVYRIRESDRNTEYKALLDYAFLTRDTLSVIHKSEIGFFDEKVYARVKERSRIEQNMKNALETEEFKVYLQPKYAIQGGVRLAGAEALVRWEPGGPELIFPDEFIPVFEENGFIVELDMYMLEHVCKIQRRWLDAGKECVPVSVNQSRLNMYTPNYVENVLRIVDKYGIPYGLLEFEVTESAVVDDIRRVKEQFTALKSLGFLTSMDDFGSGYSSLNLLKDVETDIIKIDKEFFNEAFATEGGKRIVASVIGMLQGLSYRVVAEGIETAGQVAFLKERGCDYVQGYYFGRPAPVEVFEKEHLEKLWRAWAARIETRRD